MIDNAIVSNTGRLFNRVMPSRSKNVLSFVSDIDTITPALTVSGGPTPEWTIVEGNGKMTTKSGASFSHTRTAGSGPMTVRLINTEAVKDYVTGIDFRLDGIVSSIYDLQSSRFSNLEQILIYSNNIYGDISDLVLSDTTTTILFNTNNLTGNPANILQQAPNLSTFKVPLNNLSGGLNNVSWITDLNVIWLYDNSFSSFMLPSLAGSPLADYNCRNNGASQESVDELILAIYNNRVNFTYANPSLNVGGTNSAPSGIYQYANPPVTILEKAHWLVNDTTEGFNNWIINFTPPV